MWNGRARSLVYVNFMIFKQLLLLFCLCAFASRAAACISPEDSDTSILLQTACQQSDANTRERLFSDLYNALRRPVVELSEHPYDAKQQRLLSIALGQLAQLKAYKNQYTEAQQLTQQALFYAQNSLDLSYQWYWQLGKLNAQQQAIENALKNYQKANKLLEKLRPAFIGKNQTVPTLKTATAQDFFNQFVQPFYLEFADLLLQHAKHATEENTRQAFLRQARDVIEQFKTLELENYFQDECVSIWQTQQKTIEQLLTPEAAVLYPIVLAHRTELLLTLPNQHIYQFSTEGEQFDLEQQVRAFLPNLEQKQAQRLYQWLIAPLENTLQQQQIETLIIVPQGILLTLPFAALFDGQHYLSEKYALTFTPALTLTDLRRTSAQQIDTYSRLLVGGLSEAVQTFPALPAVKQEIDNLQQIYGRSALILKNNHFLQQRIVNEIRLNNYNIIHLATHGQLRENPRDSFILTFDERLTLDELENYLKVAQFRDSPLELLTLSACETATTANTLQASISPQAALGLAGIALKAGARSALASLWAVDDKATALLMTEFYQALQQVSKARALQIAQNKLRQIPEYQHPFFWSGFILVGSWF